MWRGHAREGTPMHTYIRVEMCDSDTLSLVFGAAADARLQAVFEMRHPLRLPNTAPDAASHGRSNCLVFATLWCVCVPRLNWSWRAEPRAKCVRIRECFAIQNAELCRWQNFIKKSHTHACRHTNHKHQERELKEEFVAKKNWMDR